VPAGHEGHQICTRSCGLAGLPDRVNRGAKRRAGSMGLFDAESRSVPLVRFESMAKNDDGLAGSGL